MMKPSKERTTLMASYASTIKKADCYYGDFSGAKLFGAKYNPFSTKTSRNSGQQTKDDVTKIAACRADFVQQVFIENGMSLSGKVDTGPSIFEQAVDGVKTMLFGDAPEPTYKPQHQYTLTA
jgi:hypothetical protein